MRKIILLFLLLHSFYGVYAQSGAKTIGKLYNFDWKIVGNLKDVDIDNRDGRTIFKAVVKDTIKGAFPWFISNTIPLPYYGDSIEIRYKVKRNCYGFKFNGYIHSLTNSKSINVLDSINGKSIMNDYGWVEMKFKSPLPNKSQYLFLPLYPPKIGEMEMDFSSIKIFIDNIEYDKLDNNRKQEQFKVMPYTPISNNDVKKLNPTQIDNLIKLCQAWGYIKYHHPNCGDMQHNWDNILIQNLNKVIQSNSKLIVDSVVNEWLISLGKYEKREKQEKKDINRTSTVNLDWISQFSTPLRVKLTELRDAKTTISSYYSLSNFVAMFIASEIEYEGEEIDANLRFVALFRAWNVINYFFPYRNLIGEEWNDVLKSIIPLFANADNKVKYELAISELAAKINDAHAYNRYSEVNDYFGDNLPSTITKLVDNKYVVVDYHRNDTINNLQKGDIITKVNGVKVQDIVKNRWKYIASSNDAGKYRNIAYGLLRSKDSIVTVDYQRDGKKYIAKLKCNYKFNEVYLSPLRDTAKGAISYFSDDILYIKPLGIDNTTLSSILSDRSKYKHIIVDMRCYPNDSSPIDDEVFYKRTISSRITCTSQEYLGDFSPFTSQSAGGNRNRTFNGKLIVLVDENTQSQAEYITMDFQTYDNMVTIGSQTAGADGNVTIIKLPGGYDFSFSGVGIYYPDGGETQRVGVRIDEIVKPTIKGIREGRDEVLERAIEIVNSK